MLFDSAQSKFRSKLANDELDGLLSGSLLFPSSSGPVLNYREQEALEVLKQSTLYSIADAQGEYKLKVPPLQTKRKRSKNQDTDAGKDWFFMKKPDITPEMQEDLQGIMMRKHIDPKRFYKKHDLDKAPKFFQIGTLRNAADEPKSRKVEKAYKGKSLVEQLLVDDEKIKFTQKKWKEGHVVEKKQRRSGMNKAQKKKKLGFR